MNQEQKVIRVKVGVLELAKQLGNVSQARDRRPLYHTPQVRHLGVCGRHRYCTLAQWRTPKSPR